MCGCRCSRQMASSLRRSPPSCRRPGTACGSACTAQTRQVSQGSSQCLSALAIMGVWPWCLLLLLLANEAQLAASGTPGMLSARWCNLQRASPILEMLLVRTRLAPHDVPFTGACTGITPTAPAPDVRIAVHTAHAQQHYKYDWSHTCSCVWHCSLIR